MQLQAGIVCAIFGAAFSFSFGIWNESLTFLVVLMAIDYFTGIMATLKEGNGLSSNVGFWGLFKKGMVLLVMIIAHRLDVLLGSGMIMGSAVFFYIANELLSVIENYGRMGMPLPERLKMVVRVLRDRAGEKDGKENGEENGKEKGEKNGKVP